MFRADPISMGQLSSSSFNLPGIQKWDAALNTILAFREGPRNLNWLDRQNAVMSVNFLKHSLWMREAVDETTCFGEEMHTYLRLQVVRGSNIFLGLFCTQSNSRILYENSAVTFHWNRHDVSSGPSSKYFSILAPFNSLKYRGKL